jgi:hypothetical protein
MAAGTAILAATPDYAAIGLAAPLLVVHLPPQAGMIAMAAGLASAILSMGLGLRISRAVPPRRLFIISSV